MNRKILWTAIWVAVYTLMCFDLTHSLFFHKNKPVHITNYVDAQFKTSITNHHEENVVITNTTTVWITNIASITNVVTMTNIETLRTTIEERTIFRSILGVSLGYRFGSGTSYQVMYGYQILDFLPLFLGASVSIDSTATISALAVMKF